ncbi:MAG: hypothetical protein JW806_03700 [Sedimentisphaerales bacterium]|nr:hypothetical protein [Sedimentisphaerales bacterium]
MKTKLFILAVLMTVFISTLNSAQAALIIPQDQDKDGLHNPDYTCWMASASNLLAAAGYADGEVKTIYDRMTDMFGWDIAALPHLAVQAYLSEYPEADNLYTIVDEYWGNTYANPEFVNQQLAEDKLVSVTFWYGQSIGHSITAWENEEAGPLQGYFSDSDKDDGGDFTLYTWVDNGYGDWSLDYPGIAGADVNHIVTLSAIDIVPEPATLTILMIGSLIFLRKNKNSRAVTV